MKLEPSGLSLKTFCHYALVFLIIIWFGLYLWNMFCVSLPLYLCLCYSYIFPTIILNTALSSKVSSPKTFFSSNCWSAAPPTFWSHNLYYRLCSGTVNSSRTINLRQNLILLYYHTREYMKISEFDDRLNLFFLSALKMTSWWTILSFS